MSGQSNLESVQTFFQTKVPVVADYTDIQLQDLALPEGTLIVSIAEMVPTLYLLGMWNLNQVMNYKFRVNEVDWKMQKHSSSLIKGRAYHVR